MTQEPDDTLAAEPIAPLIGARVLAGKQVLLSGRHAARLRTLLEERGVLVFPRIHFSAGEQVAFTRTLGEYAPDTPEGAPTAISIDPAGGGNADYTRASFFWHFDGYFNDVPILASILCAERLAEAGGDTEFANTYAAYEALPDERKRQIEGLGALHSLAAAQRSVDPEPSHETLGRWRQVRASLLPLVWRHRSGRRSLVIGNTALAVPGMDPLESLDLLVYLRDFATRPRFTYRHVWSPGDAVMWDNTGTLHRALPYRSDSGRLMRRTKLAGEEPFAG